MKKLIMSSIFFVLAMSSSLVSAAMVEITPLPISNSFTHTIGKKTLTFTFDDSKTGTYVDRIFAGDGKGFPQNPTSVAGVVKSTFGISSLSLSAHDNFPDKTNSATIKSSIAYDYLAIHMGQYEVFFHFAALVAADKEFEISSSGKGSGLSNFRAYDSGISAVPVPAAAFLFAPALLGFMGLRRKAKNKVS